MTQPLVSVLMTAFNREKYIGEAIESVLASSYKNFELIIVDDCSSDNTIKIARIYETKDKRINVYKNEENLGDYPNRNMAAFYGKGKYIKFLDSDDIMYPHCLQVMVNSMEMFPEAGFGLSSIAEENQSYPICISPRNIYLEHFNGYGHFDRAPGSAIIKKDSFEKIGKFTGERMIGDYQLWFKMGKEFPMVKFPRDLVWDRLHSGQEIKSDYARNYNKLKEKILFDALDDPECPLTKHEKKLCTQSSKVLRLTKKLKLS